MTGIGSNIVGSVAASQVTASQTNKKSAAERNKQTSDSRELARLAEQQTHEVEDADQTENIRVYSEDERQREDQAGDDEAAASSDSSEVEESSQTYDPHGLVADAPKLDDNSDHVDLSA